LHEGEQQNGRRSCITARSHDYIVLGQRGVVRRVRPLRYRTREQHREVLTSTVMRPQRSDGVVSEFETRQHHLPPAGGRMKYEVHREKSPAFVPVTVTLELDTPEKLNAFTALAVFSLRAGTAVDVALNDRYTPAPGAEPQHDRRPVPGRDGQRPRRAGRPVAHPT
jgi:hypothetical protein